MFGLTPRSHGREGVDLAEATHTIWRSLLSVEHDPLEQSGVDGNTGAAGE